MKPVIARNFRLPPPFPGQTYEDQKQNYWLACLIADVDSSQTVLTDKELAAVGRAFSRIQHEHMLLEFQADDAVDDIANDEDDEDDEVGRCVDEWMESAPADVHLALLEYASMASRRSPASAQGRSTSREVWGVSRQATAKYRAQTINEARRLLISDGPRAALQFAERRWSAHVCRRQQRREQPHQLELWG